MAFKPKHKCLRPGCPAIIPAGQSYCERHKQHGRNEQRRRNQRRLTSTQRGYDQRWAKARREYLRQRPWCAVCAQRGERIQATVVDHIKPHKGNQQLFWDQRNWQPLCATCHNRKTATTDGGFGRQQT